MVPTVAPWRGVWSDLVVPTVVPTNGKALYVSCFLRNLTVTQKVETTLVVVNGKGPSLGRVGKQVICSDERR